MQKQERSVVLNILTVFMVLVSGSLVDGLAQRFALSDPYVWNFILDEQEAKLAYGVPNSDEVGLMMTCTPHSGSVTVAGDVGSGEPHLILASGDARTRFSSSAQADPMNGARWIEAHTSTRDRALTAFARTGALTLDRQGRRTTISATSDDRRAVRRFFATCA